MFSDKKIVLMGLGSFAQGSGLSAARFLIGRCRELVITDLKPAKELKEQIREIKKFVAGISFCPPLTKGGIKGGLIRRPTKITWHLGGHRKEDFETADWIIRNPDVPADSPFLKIAQKRKIPIDNDLTLFFRVNGVQNVIGVTGTRGKSTTASLIYEMVRRQYPEAKLGGNIGVSPLNWVYNDVILSPLTSLRVNFAKNLDPSVAPLPQDDVEKTPVILEISSFQLHDLPTVKMSPRVAVWTNFYPDHLNKYKSLEEYKEDKRNMLKYQGAGDVAVLNWDNEETRKAGEKIKSKIPNPKSQINPKIPNPKFQKIYWFSLKFPVKDGVFIKNGWFVFSENGKLTKVTPVSATKLLGEHNRANILAAICAARAYGLGWPAIRSTIKEFRGLPNRLEVIRPPFINDCTATSPEATIAALKSFPAKKIILISGGNSKGSSLKKLAREISQRARVLILVPGNANAEILKDIKIFNIKYSIFQVSNLKEAVVKAIEAARRGDVILFSPGLTWLPRMNEFERGEEFKKIVNGLDGDGS